jgi:hypothetical protein
MHLVRLAVKNDRVSRFTVQNGEVYIPIKTHIRHRRIIVTPYEIREIDTELYHTAGEIDLRKVVLLSIGLVSNYQREDKYLRLKSRSMY